MTGLHVRLLERDFSEPLAEPPVTYAVKRYACSALGGPRDAEIDVTGRPAAVWELIEKLRCPIEIANARGEARWWGYINTVEIAVGVWTIGVTLDSMTNKVAVTYSYVAPGTNEVGERRTTDWAQNADSIIVYGQRESKASLGGATPAQAEALRTVLLAQQQYPIPSLRAQRGQAALTAKLTCLGWWQTLDWRYLAQSAGLESYQPTSGVEQSVGAAAANARAAQSFQLSSSQPWTAYSVKLQLRKQGTPTDNLLVDLCIDSAGVPGTVLTSVTLAGSSLPTSLDWVEFVFTTPVTLALATTYWLVMRRSGAVDAANYYVMTVGPALGYASGVYRLYNGSSWVARSPDADAAFQVTGVQETTEQIRYAIQTYAPFITAVEIQTASGVYSSQYRDGATLLLAEIEALLKSGTTNGRRLLATITRERVLCVYEEPTSGDQDYLIISDGSLHDALDRPVPPDRCLVGAWARVNDVIPATVDVSKLADPTRVFIESADYDAETMTYTPEPRALPSVWDLGQSG